MRRTKLVFMMAGIFASLAALSARAEGEVQNGSVPPPPQIQSQPQPGTAMPEQQPGNAPAADAASPQNDTTTPDTGSQQSTSQPAQQMPGSPGMQSSTLPAPRQQEPGAPPSYDLNTIIVDFKERKIGDIIPQEYRSKPYEIVEWQKRHLPAPEENSHWTYVGGNYLLIANDSGKILKAESGDIFFSQ